MTGPGIARGVDDARLDMFAQKQKPYEAIPPTQAALHQHVKHATSQAGYIWSQSLVCQPETQSPAHWGWTKTGHRWQIVWTMLPAICRELPVALQVWMQDRMLWTMQMPSFWSNSLCSCKCET